MLCPHGTSKALVLQSKGTLQGDVVQSRDQALYNQRGWFPRTCYKARPDNKEFELVITTAPIPDLNDKLIVFGRVIKGEEVVQV